MDSKHSSSWESNLFSMEISSREIFLETTPQDASHLRFSFTRSLPKESATRAAQATWSCAKLPAVRVHFRVQTASFILASSWSISAELSSRESATVLRSLPSLIELVMVECSPNSTL